MCTEVSKGVTSRRFFPVFVVTIFFAVQVLADDGNCQLTNLNGDLINNDTWRAGYKLEIIKDTEVCGKKLLELKTKNIKNITHFESDTKNKLGYIVPEVSNDAFSLSLTDEFQHYEENEDSDEIKVKVTFLCEDGKTRTMDIYQKIEDTNNHDPEFLQSEYEYVLPMPLPPNLKLELFGRKIAARDIDIANKNISFSMNSSDTQNYGLSVDWDFRDENDTKKHYATLRTAGFLNLRENAFLDLYATDSGEPKRTSKTLLSIKIDKNQTYPRFNKPLYIANYKTFDLETNKNIKFENGPIALSQGSDETVKYNLACETSASYEHIFEPIVNAENSSIVDIRLKEILDSLRDESFIVFTLTVLKPGPLDVAVLHVSLPGKRIYSDESSNCTTAWILTILLIIILICVIAATSVIAVKNRNLLWNRNKVPTTTL